MTKASQRSQTQTTGLILLYLALVLPLAYFLNIWSDEASTLYSTQHGIVDALHHAAANEKQAPLYFWVISLWRSVNDSIFFARLFSVICGAVAIKLFSGFVNRILDARAALIATAFFAFHPFFIWASLEVRVYALVILLSIILFRLFISAFWDANDGAPEWRDTVLFLLTATVSLYTNYYLGFLLAGLFVALLAARRWKAAGYYACIMAVTGLAFVPLLFAMRSQFLTNTSGFQAERSLLEGVQRLWRHFLTFVLPAGVFPDGDGSAVLVVRLWIVRVALVVAAVLAFKRRNSISQTTVAAFALVTTIFLGLQAAYFLVGPEYLEIRHTALLFVPLIVFLASLLSDLFKDTTSKFVVLIPALVVLISFAFSLSILYPGMTKRGDWARVGAFIEQKESQGQPIVVFTTFDALALPYHYHGVNRVLPDERYFDFEQEAEFGSVDSLRRQTDFVISKIPPEADHIWLVLGEKCMTTNACIPLQNFVAANYTIETEQEFYLEKVFLLKKKVR